MGKSALKELSSLVFVNRKIPFLNVSLGFKVHKINDIITKWFPRIAAFPS